MKSIKSLLIFLIVFLLLLPASGLAQEKENNTKTPNDIMSTLKRNVEPKKLSKKMKELYRSPSDYPFVNEGEFVGRLMDSQYTYHDITYGRVADYSDDYMQLNLLYQSKYFYIKDRYLWVEIWRDVGGNMEYMGNFEYDSYGYSQATLRGYFSKSYFEDQQYLYFRVGVLAELSDNYYSDEMIFKVVNPFYTGEQKAVEGNKYALISNESVQPDQTQFTGTFSINNDKYTMNKKMGRDAYQLDVNRPFDTEKHADKKLKRKLAKRLLNQIGDTKSFWAYNFTTDRDYQLEAKLLYSGTKTNVWVNNNQITSADAQKLGQEFDQKIHSSVTQNFANESDVDGNGKVNILCFDIQDGFNGYGGYIAGYFYGGDLFDIEASNRSEIFYIDTYPLMGMGLVKNVSAAYDTLAHEFQHMVNFNQNVLVEGGLPMDTWLNESLSMAAEQIYSGKVQKDRIDYYNYANSITNGHSLLYWDNFGDTLSNYSLSYLFGQYVRTQAGQGNSIFKEVLTDTNNDYRAVENAAKRYIDPSITFGKLMTNFRGALLLKQKTGAYGFKGEAGFDAIEPKIFTGSSANLRGGGAVVKKAADKKIPVNKGNDITYTFFDLNKEEPEDVTPPGKPLIEPVGDRDTAVYGLAEPGATIYVQRDSSTIGSGIADEAGAFTIAIEKQKAGTVLSVIAVDRVGNRSEATRVTVMDRTPPEAPVVNEVSDFDKVVTGIAEAGSTVRVESVGNELGNAKAGSNGKFSVPLPSVQKAGTVLYVVAENSSGNASPVTQVTVVGKTPPKAPTVSPVSDRDKSVKGTAEAGSTVTVKAGSKVLNSATADKSGKFTVTLKNAQKAGTVLYVTATDKARNVSSARKVTVIDKTPPATPTVSIVSDRVKKVSGKAEPGSKVTVKAGSKVLSSATTAKNGKFTVTLKTTQKAGRVLYVTATDKARNVSKARKVTVVDKTPPAVPRVNKVTIKSTAVKGKAEANSTVYVKAGKKIIGSAKASKSGSFSVKIKKQKSGTTLQVYAKDRAGNTSKNARIKVQKT